MNVTQQAVVVIDPLFDDAGAAAMVELCSRFGRYQLYAEHDQHEVDLGRGLVPRHDSVLNFLRSKRTNGASTNDVISRTSYFREEYAYGGEPLIDGIGPFLNHPALLDAARAIHGLPVIEPAIAYANLYLPGQELAVHTDVPEFRGANRKKLPQWLLVVMHHSGLFDAWRLPIVTAIAYFHAAEGGALVFWPDGADGLPQHLEPRANSAIVLDTDSVFHGVEPVGSGDVPVPELAAGTELVADDDRTGWTVVDGEGRELARYRAADLRFSVSWKAYAFADDDDVRVWRDHTDDLTYEVIVDRLVADLRERRRVDGDVVPDRDLGLTMIDEYVHFPA